MRKLSIIILAVIFTASCTPNLENLNKNKKDPTSVSGESLFASAEKRLADQMLTPNVNYNNTRLWVQHWQETTYTDESNYDQSTRSIPDRHWRVMYRDVLKNLKRSKKIIDETDNVLTNDLKPNKEAIIEILSVYAYSNLVETFGNIPYSQALDINNTLPKFDDGETVYKDLLARLDDALDSMDPGKASFSATEDLIYGGDVTSWMKFGNTLKLRMGMVLADVDHDLSVTTVNSAYNSSVGVFASNEDAAAYKYSSAAPNNNPVNNELVLSGRHDYVAAKTIVDMMNGLKDQRRADYFAANLNDEVGTVQDVDQSGGVTTINFSGSIDVPNATIVGNPIYLNDDPTTPTRIGTVTAVNGNSLDIMYVNQLPDPGAEVIYVSYKGGTIGVGSPDSDYSTNSHPNPAMTQGGRPGTILSYVETEFLLAEAAARGNGYNVGDAETHYDAAIEASFAKWGAVGVEDYLQKPEVDYQTALGNSSSSPAWKEVIGIQAWLGLYGQSFAPYLSIRRLDYPILTEPASARSGFPVRYPYPVSSQNLNEANWEQASSAIGGDETTTQLFWDKYYTFPF